MRATPVVRACTLIRALRLLHRPRPTRQPPQCRPCQAIRLAVFILLITLHYGADRLRLSLCVVVKVTIQLRDG
jgi:hypothetical protein